MLRIHDTSYIPTINTFLKHRTMLFIRRHVCYHLVYEYVNVPISATGDNKLGNNFNCSLKVNVACGAIVVSIQICFVVFIHNKVFHISYPFEETVQYKS